MATSEEQRERNKEYDRAHNIRYYQANKERILAYKHANREKIAEVQKAYSQANREKIGARKKAYYVANKERTNANCAAYRRTNKEKIVAHYQANKERIIARKRGYAQANPGKVNATSAKRKAAKLQRTPNWLTREDYRAIRTLYETAAALTKATGIKHHVDHIIPLQGRTVSGFHCPTNLQILTQSENCSKHNKFTGDE